MSVVRLALLAVLVLLGGGAPLAFGQNALRSAYTNSVGARSAWLSESTKTRALISKAKGVADAISVLSKEIEGKQKELKNLKAEKERALEEMRKGRFCSKCERPASQIERELRVTFDYHVADVGGFVQRATPEQIAKVEDHYDGLIKPLNSHLEELENSKRERESECLHVGSDLNLQIGVYHKHIDGEAKLRGMEWHNEREKLDTEIDEVVDGVTEAERALSRNREAEKTGALQANLRILQKQLTDTHRRAQASQNRAEQQATDFIKAATADIESLRKAASTLGEACWNATAFMTRAGLKKAIFCPITPLRNYEMEIGGKDLRNLLEAGNPIEKAAPAPQKSIRELLEGK